MPKWDGGYTAALTIAVVTGAALGFVFGYFTIGTDTGSYQAFGTYLQYSLTEFSQGNPLAWSTFGALMGAALTLFKFLTNARN
ncbi:hypothetical protein [Alteraurantiacibacter buctensis]|uniref:Uncharacterized protein n=1 Tax=Alteraurantiacibacter buctensis TaxID=1503981 RepID=A0A844YZK4_9SPHN|nr:hypothetical protein [Alteraurantiacibacter buctensis]MXO72370.1 hypothetical protein [Alteraurantiacibacter buctensis]